MRFAFAICFLVFLSASAKEPTPPPADKVLRFRSTELRIQDGWCLDNNGHIWSILASNGNILGEWNGERWLPHEIPADMRKDGISAVTIDSRNRIWLLPNSIDMPAAFCDSRDGKWQIFPKIETAFEAVKNDPPQFEQDHPNFYSPAYSPDRRCIAFLSKQWDVVYFDGSAWHHWRRGPEFAPGSHGLDAPFFDDDGRLSVTIAGDPWQLNDQGKWQQVKVKPRSSIRAEQESRRKPGIATPDGCVTDSPNSIALDNENTYWLTWQGKLYKSLPGICIRVFSEDEPDPFGDGRRIEKVWVDQHGNAFLKTGLYTCIMVTPKLPPPPKPPITMEKTAADAVTVRFHGDSRSKMQFRWHLDDEPWQLTKDKTLLLDSLPNGSHALSATTIDEELQKSVPAVKEFVIRIDSAKQIGRLIKQLAGHDPVKRESTVRALVRQPATALPALKTAREKAGSDQRWWIDATIQEIERNEVKRTTNRRDDAPARP